MTAIGLGFSLSTPIVLPFFVFLFDKAFCVFLHAFVFSFMTTLNDNQNLPKRKGGIMGCQTESSAAKQ